MHFIQAKNHVGFLWDIYSMRLHARSSNLFNLSLLFSHSLFQCFYLVTVFLNLTGEWEGEEPGWGEHFSRSFLQQNSWSFPPHVGSANHSTSPGHSCKQNSWSFTPHVGSANHSIALVIPAKEQLIIPARGFSQSKCFSDHSCNRTADNTRTWVQPVTALLQVILWQNSSFPLDQI